MQISYTCQHSIAQSDLLFAETTLPDYELFVLQYEEHATYRDPESLEEVLLVPGMSRTENMLRWGFIKSKLPPYCVTC